MTDHGAYLELLNGIGACWSLSLITHIQIINEENNVAMS